jgi:hypothetical protein
MLQQEVTKTAFAGQLGWLTSTLDESLIYLAAFILSRKYAALIMKSTPGLMKRAMPLRLRTHSFRHDRASSRDVVSGDSMDWS